MIAIGLLLVRMLCDCFKPRSRLEAEILILRHQLNVLQQRRPRPRLHLRWADRRPVHLALSSLPSHSGCHEHRQARDCRALASQGSYWLLAMEIRLAAGQEVRDLIRRKRVSFVSYVKK
jgi:hypothetical protein